MKRNIIISVIIGTLATYLPFWQWDGLQVAGAIALSMLAWMLLQGTEPELSKKTIASGIHISFEIGLAGYPCRVWVEESPENKMTTYDIYREEVMMKESVKNYEAAREHLTRLLKENGS